MRRTTLSHLLPLLLALGLLGCPKRVGSQSDLDPASREKVEEAKRQAQAGNTEEALRLLRDVPTQENEGVADGLFAVAEAQFQAREFASARDSYRELLARFPLFGRADQAKYHLAVAHMELGESRDALQTLTPLFERLPEEEKPLAAQQLARAAEGARAWPEAIRWHAEAMARARDEASQKYAYERCFQLIDAGIPFVEVARLAQELPQQSPILPLVKFKLAKIFAHLRDHERLQDALEELIAEAPSSPFIPEARAMLEREKRRGLVRPGTLGIAVPLSGKYKSFGDTVLAGVQLALQGSQVKLVTRDTAGDPSQARRAITELVQDEQVMAIIGPVLTAESEDAAAEAELLEVPIVTLTRAEGITNVGDWVFRNMLTNSAQAAALVDWAMRVRGMKTFALMYPNIPYGNELANFFWDEVEARGGEIRGVESYEADQTTFGAVVKKLVGRYWLDLREDYVRDRKEIIANVKDPFRQRKMLEDRRKKLEPIIDFEALFIPDYFKGIGQIAPTLAVEDIVTNACDEKDMERIAKTIGKEDGELKTVQLLGGNGWNFPELVERGQKFVQCSVFVDGFFINSDRPQTQAFVEAFRKAYNRDPTLLEAEGYDTAKMLRLILDGQKPTSRAAVRDGLLKIHDFQGATGRTRFNAKREAEKPLFMLTIDRGEIRELDSETPRS